MMGISWVLYVAQVLKGDNLDGTYSSEEDIEWELDSKYKYKLTKTNCIQRATYNL